MSAAPSFSFSRPVSSMHLDLVPEAIQKDRLLSYDIAGLVHLAREGTSGAMEALLPHRSEERLKKKNLCQSVGGGESKAPPLWSDIT